jgi:hypothetical protein
MRKPWTAYYKVIGIIPGRVLIPGTGQVDLSDEKLPLKLIRKIHEKGCTFLTPVQAQEPPATEQKVPDKYTAKELARLIKDAVNADEAMRLYETNPSSKLAEQAYKKKLLELGGPSGQ